MTNASAPRQTARDEIAATAAKHGWSMYATSDRRNRFVRGDVAVAVSFTRAGAVRFADLLTSGRSAVTGSRGRRETVLAWLAALPTEDEINRAVEQADPAGIPTVDEVATAIADGTRLAGSYATLDEAEAGQPRASLDRLGELAAAGARDLLGGQGLVRDHVSVVRQRIAELEAELSVQRKRAERAEATDDQTRGELGHALDRIAALEVQAVRMVDTALAAQNEWNTDRSRLALRIAELESEREHNELAYEREQHEQTRNALLSEEGRAAELEDIVSKLTGATVAVADGRDARIAELEAELREVRSAAQGSGTWAR